MTDLVTRLSISVSGKADGKEIVADMIAAGIQHFGGAIPQRKGDKNGQYLTVELPAAAMAALVDGKATSPAAMVSHMGEDVEIRDGMIRARRLEITGTPMPLQIVLNKESAGRLLPLDSAKAQVITNLLIDRAHAFRLLNEEDVRAQSVTVPAFVDKDRIGALLMESANGEIARIDRDLAALGVRFGSAK